MATAFGLLQEALEGEAAQVAQRIAKAAEARRYDEVRELNEQAELLGGITEEVRDLSKRWTPLVPEPPEQDQTGIRLVLRHKGCDARALFHGTSTVVVTAGSTLVANTGTSFKGPPRDKRRMLAQKGSLVPADRGLLKLREDVACTSPSSAATFVVGYSANGRLLWHLEDSHRPLGSWIESQGHRSGIDL
ncbi:MAG: DUF4357 domain-containing protein [Gammaproteobacteria bacterium]|nr:DUF4357 domain-containing protein [Gammaproteobacteria bacterium]